MSYEKPKGGPPGGPMSVGYVSPGPERQEPASPASAYSVELREKVAQAIRRSMGVPGLPDDEDYSLADAAIAAGAGPGSKAVEALEAIRDGHIDCEPSVFARAAIAAMRGGDE